MSDFAKEIISVNIEDELKQSYLSYALSVIHGRALPDIRDGPQTSPSKNIICNV